MITFPDDGLGNDDVQGDPFPDVVLIDRDDNEVTTGDLLGEPLVVNLWYSTCPPCAKELPRLRRGRRRDRRRSDSSVSTRSIRSR